MASARTSHVVRLRKLTSAAAPPNFTPLPRRYYFPQPAHYAVWLFLPLAVFPLAGLACFIAFGVLKNRHPHTWPTNVRALLVAAPIVWVCGWLIVIASLWVKELFSQMAWMGSFRQAGTSRSFRLLRFLLKIDEENPWLQLNV